MSLNLLVVVAAIVIGVVSAIAANPGTSDMVDWAALGRGLLVAAGMSAFAVFGVLLLFGRDIFAVTHMVYVIITVGAPLAGC